ncbi:hypothetical protein [Vibrio ouci]|uniref:Uncharacterized protein n=1 Tax=Vibrio ouci TaxID=2499078 RepID=A0A4Y8WEU6_9VIBR|nr:hypothetical protein [Vibrio ouci]TFH91145.1 hypothetical protein ELS82_13575 [Vibrio ouci]
MSQIKWEAVEAPEHRVSMYGMQQAGDAFDRALKGLESIATRQNEINQQNYDVLQNAALAENQARYMAMSDDEKREFLSNPTFAGDTVLSGDTKLKFMDAIGQDYDNMMQTERSNNAWFEQHGAKVKADQDAATLLHKRGLEENQQQHGFNLGLQNDRQQHEVAKLVTDYANSPVSETVDRATGKVTKIYRTPEEVETYRQSLLSGSGMTSSQTSTTPNVAQDAALIAGGSTQSQQAKAKLTGGVTNQVDPLVRAAQQQQQQVTDNENRIIGRTPVTPTATTPAKRTVPSVTEQLDQVDAVTTPVQRDTSHLAPTTGFNTGNESVDNFLSTIQAKPVTGYASKEKQEAHQTKIDKASEVSEPVREQLTHLKDILANPVGMEAASGVVAQHGAKSGDWASDMLASYVQTAEGAADAVVKALPDSVQEGLGLQSDQQIDERATQRANVRTSSTQLDSGSFVQLIKEAGSAGTSNQDSKDFKVSVSGFEQSRSNPQAFKNTVIKTTALLEYKTRRLAAEAEINRNLNQREKSILMKQVESDLGIVRLKNGNFDIRPQDQQQAIDEANQQSIDAQPAPAATPINSLFDKGYEVGDEVSFQGVNYIIDKNGLPRAMGAHR